MGKKAVVSMLLLLFAAMLALAGCTSNKQPAGNSSAGSNNNSSNSPSANGGSSAESQGEVVITYWDWADYIKEEGSPGLEMIKEFNEKHKGKIRVEPRFIVSSEYATAIQAAISSGDLPDIFSKQGDLPIRVAVEQNLIRPIDELVSDDWKNQYYEGTFVEGINMIDGNIYTFPIIGPELLYMLYYNVDVMKAAGLNPDQPPKTWDELRAMAKTVTEQGKGDVYGLVLGASTGGYPHRFVQGFAEGISPLLGTPFNFQTGKYNYDQQPWVDSVQFMLDLKSDGSILPSSYNLNHAEAGVLFGEGKAAFLLDTRWRMWQIKRDTPDANFNITNVPTRDGSIPTHGYLSSGVGIAVSSGTKHPEAVGTFIEEGLGSRAFYDRYFGGGVALTPFPEVNQDTSNYSYPQMKQWVELHERGVVALPDPVIVNPMVSSVYQEIGNMVQNKIKPTADELMLSLIMGAETDIPRKLREYNERLNQGLIDGIDAVKQDGVEVDIADFIFPNWEPGQSYTNEHYKALK